jgi:hypothetical protein
VYTCEAQSLAYESAFTDPWTVQLSWKVQGSKTSSDYAAESQKSGG